MADYSADCQQKFLVLWLLWMRQPWWNQMTVENSAEKFGVCGKHKSLLLSSCPHIPCVVLCAPFHFHSICKKNPTFNERSSNLIWFPGSSANHYISKLAISFSIRFKWFEINSINLSQQRNVLLENTESDLDKSSVKTFLSIKHTPWHFKLQMTLGILRVYGTQLLYKPRNKPARFSFLFSLHLPCRVPGGAIKWHKVANSYHTINI